MYVYICNYIEYSSVTRIYLFVTRIYLSKLSCPHVLSKAQWALIYAILSCQFVNELFSYAYAASSFDELSQALILYFPSYRVSAGSSSQNCTEAVTQLLLGILQTNIIMILLAKLRLNLFC